MARDKTHDLNHFTEKFDLTWDFIPRLLGRVLRRSIFGRRGRSRVSRRRCRTFACPRFRLVLTSLWGFARKSSWFIQDTTVAVFWEDAISGRFTHLLRALIFLDTC